MSEKQERNSYTTPIDLVTLERVVAIKGQFLAQPVGSCRPRRLALAEPAMNRTDSFKVSGRHCTTWKKTFFFQEEISWDDDDGKGGKEEDGSQEWKSKTTWQNVLNASGLVGLGNVEFVASHRSKSFANFSALKESHYLSAIISR